MEVFDISKDDEVNALKEKDVIIENPPIDFQKIYSSQYWKCDNKYNAKIKVEEDNIFNNKKWRWGIKSRSNENKIH